MDADKSKKKIKLLKILAETDHDSPGELLLQFIMIGVIWFLIGSVLFMWIGGYSLEEYATGFFIYMTQMNIFGIVVGIFTLVWVSLFLWRRLSKTNKEDED